MERLTGTSAEKAKAVLIALCSNDRELRDRAEKLLDDMDNLEATKSPCKQGQKRKAESAIKICVKCQEPFDEEDNSNKACRYHSGDLEVDDNSSVWDDHDENCHGLIDTLGNRMEFPEGFVWDCCKKPGHRRGCTRGKHDATSAHRGRYGTKPGTWTTNRDSSDAKSSDLEVSELGEESDA